MFISNVCIISCSSLCSLSEEHLMGPSIFFCLSVCRSLEVSLRIRQPALPGVTLDHIVAKVETWIIVGTQYWNSGKQDILTDIRVGSYHKSYFG
jgi:hypothetical protein